MKKKNEVLTFRPSRDDKANIRLLKKTFKKLNRSDIIRKAIAYLAANV